ncbi:MAG: UDP-N-acetylmuramate--L-alanine ligase, partial [Chthoniobacterales bacterium]|nr:UDP-N-acetylmuramate--L-alanine ligase [Chthoniobacterales bacterium]
GLDFACPYREGQMDGAEVVIYSSAVRSGNPGYDEAKRRGLPMFLRAEALAALMSGKRGIVICGMHGKTTTTAMLAHVLRAAGLKPSHYVGAEIPILGTNARWDSDGEYFVAEGDESDGTLVLYEPEHAVVLNVEREHLDYYRSLEEIEKVFGELVKRTRGLVVACGEDEGAMRVSKQARGRIVYGERSLCDYRMVGLRIENGRPVFRVKEFGEDLGEIHLGIPGRHNALNSMAVVAVSRRIGVSFEVIANALQRFEGARRRFETLYRDEEFLVVDDYGHHPTEIAATLDTARLMGQKRTVVMFQPHRFTRTQALRREFGGSFRECEILVVTEIYAASEQPIEGVSGKMIAESVQEMAEQGERIPEVIFEDEMKKLPSIIGPKLEVGDLILSLGAGNIHEVGRVLAEDLGIRRKIREAMGDGKIRLYEPMWKHTTLRVGGPARFWVEPETEEGFAEVIRLCTEEKLPILVVGRGSNLLVKDGGFKGVVVHLGRGEFLRCEVDGNLIHVGAGVRLKQLAAIAKKHGLGGFEWMEGIP